VAALPLAAVLAGMSFSGWVATLAGWYVTEIGRQPFICWSGVLRTTRRPPRVPAPMIALTLALYLTVYLRAARGLCRRGEVHGRRVDKPVEMPAGRPAGRTAPNRACEGPHEHEACGGLDWAPGGCPSSSWA
jgi:cytochrome d ubiquinol oxidase subunit I